MCKTLDVLWPSMGTLLKYWLKVNLISLILWKYNIYWKFSIVGEDDSISSQIHCKHFKLEDISRALGSLNEVWEISQDWVECLDQFGIDLR